MRSNSVRARVGIEPVKGLTGGNQLHTPGGQRRLFGAPCHAGEESILSAQLVRGLAHLPVGLNAKDPVAVVEK